MKSIETERYILRIPRIEDAEEIYERWGTDKEKMAQYKAHKVYRNVIEAEKIIKQYTYIQFSVSIPQFFI